MNEIPIQIEEVNTANHYVNKEEFQAAMVERRLLVEKCKAEGKESPRVSEYIGKCIYDIATHLGYKYNFIGYSYRDEMISDGIENCLRYLDNFDSVNYKNPFAYFTQICWYAFIRRIGREKKQGAIKTKLIREIPFEMFELQAHDENGDFSHAFMDFLQMHDTTDTTAFDSKKEKKPRKKKGEVAVDEPSLSEFIDEEMPLPEGLIEAELYSEDE